MAILKFQTNIPVEVRLRSIEGEETESQFGGKQFKFVANEGMFYVSEAVGGILMDQFRRLSVKPGLPVEITKAEVSKGNGRKGISWIVSVVGEAPAEPVTPVAKAAPTELERQLAQSIAVVEARKQPQQATEALPKWAQVLGAQTRHLVDVYADVVNYASAKHGNAVKPEDVRAMMTTVFINLSKGGNANAA